MEEKLYIWQLLLIWVKCGTCHLLGLNLSSHQLAGPDGFGGRNIGADTTTKYGMKGQAASMAGPKSAVSSHIKRVQVWEENGPGSSCSWT